MSQIPSDKNSLAAFYDIHEGSKCFILGAGTSLYGMDLSCIHEYPVICVNSSILAVSWNQPGDVLKRFWMSTDILCMQWDYFQNCVMKYDCTRIVRSSWARDAAKFQGVHFNYYFTRRNRDTLKPKGEGILGSSSIMSAIDMALVMGCKKIYLLGVDHKMVSGFSHFWQNWPKEKQPKREGRPKEYIPCQRQQGRVFQSNFRAFEVFIKYSAQLGAKIYNCSPISEVNTFEKLSFEDALRMP